MSVPDELPLAQVVAGEVRAHLARNRLTGRSAAFALGWTQQYISRRLNGTVAFDVADLDAVSKLLGVPVTAFFQGPAASRVTAAAGLNKLGFSAPLLFGLAA